MEQRLGEIGYNTYGTPMKIIRYNKSADIDIEFQDEFHYIKQHQSYSNFRLGCIKNPYDKNICGVGYMGVGKYHSKYSNGTHTLEYQNWISMIRRCYDPQRKNVYAAYYGSCETCEEWHNFQTFGEWYENNYYQVGNERMHIDKDILFQGNRIYSPETCLIVPQRINMLFVNKPNKRGLPNGIRKAYSKYWAKYNNEELGSFDCLNDAFAIYAKRKEQHIKQVADEYKQLIPVKLYNALYNYKVIIENDKNYVM